MAVDVYLNSFLNLSARWGWVVSHTTPLHPQQIDPVPTVQAMALWSTQPLTEMSTSNISWR
jgi:hypothetical protein